MYVERYRLVVPSGVPFDKALLAAAGSHDKVEVYSGQKSVTQVGVDVEGSGAWARGHIDATIVTYDYKAAYQVYGLDNNKEVDYWFVSYKRDEHQDVLKQTFENSVTDQVNISLDFELEGNDFGVTAVFITYQVIRMVLNGVTKDYVTTNKQNAGAAAPDGSPYPGGFKPV